MHLHLALIAHDKKKDDMAYFVLRHLSYLKQCDIVATASTANRIIKAAPDLLVTSLKSGPLGGDQQIGSLICEQKIDALVFFVDPLEAMPHDVDVKALTRLAIVYNILMALNPSTADTILFAASKKISVREYTT